mmetsp:Transcript_15042/g.25699  ORF Transcript_15042/g.25699 Transcript_15042/m.25699 type:complete len:87 (-) Transcript_15042:187-447(-)
MVKKTKMCGLSHFSHHTIVMGNLFQSPLLSNEPMPTQSDQTIRWIVHHLLLGFHRIPQMKGESGYTCWLAEAASLCALSTHSLIFS